MITGTIGFVDVPVRTLLAWRDPSKLMDRTLHRTLTVKGPMTVGRASACLRVMPHVVLQAASRLERDRLLHQAHFRPRLLRVRTTRLTAVQRGRRAMWTRRHQRYGPSGMSPEAVARQRRVVMKAHEAVRRKGRASHCRQGHKMTVANTRWGTVDRRCASRRRYCRACDVLANAKQSLVRQAARRAA